jgi:flavin reductase
MSSVTLLETPALETVTPARYREGMACLAGAVNIVTTDGPGGRAGFTASAVCSVTDTPPTLLVCINESSSAGPVFALNQAICVNTVSGAHEELAMLFGGRTPMEERFVAAQWRTGVSGAPVLQDSLVSFDCVIDSTKTVGTHRVLFCRVVDVEVGTQEGASVYFSRKFHQLPR